MFRSAAPLLLTLILALHSVVPSARAAPGLPDDKSPAGVKAAAFLKKYRHASQEFDAGFVPDKVEVVHGEPIRATFTLRNPSAQPFAYWFGGDYRGTGRHDRFKVEATGGGSEPLTDPKAGPDGAVPNFGGMVQLRTIKPGDVEAKVLDLTAFRTFPGPGTYEITCRFTVQTGGKAQNREEPAFTVENTYRLTVLPRTDVNVARVRRELVSQALRERGEALDETVRTLGSFAGEQAVPDLVRLAADAEPERRAAALRGLGPFVSERSMAAALRGLDDPADAVRIAAADALGTMKQDPAVETLSTRWPGEKVEVAGAMLRALGRTRAARAVPTLREALSRDDRALQRAAVDGLVAHGDEPAVAALTALTADPDLDRREFVIAGLVEGLRQPMKVEWVLPLIRAGKDYPNGRNPNESLRLLRLYGGERAAPELIRLLDLDDPTSRTGRNFWILHHLGGVRDAPRVTWQYDPNRGLTPQELDANRRALAVLREWLARHDEKPGAK